MNAYLQLHTSRILYLLPALLLSPGNVSAQTSVLPSDPHDPCAYIAPAAAGSTGTAAKASGALLRLTGTSSYLPDNGVLGPVDSSGILYAGTTTVRNEMINYRQGAGKWVQSNRYRYTYAATLNTQTELQSWNSNTSAFIPLARYNYTYNAAMGKTGMLYEIWKQSTSSYINGMLETYTLDASNNMTDFVQQIWNVAGAKWGNNQHVTQVWTAQGKVADYILQLWDGNTNLWNNKTRVMTTYDAGGQQIKVQNTYYWSPDSMKWLDAQRTTSTVMQGSKIQTAVTEVFNIKTHSWNPGGRTNNTYNSAGDYATVMQEQWDDMTGQYVNSTKTSYSYNSQAQPTVTGTLDWVSGTWAVGSLSGRSTNYYEALAHGVGVASQQAGEWRISVSPVPASGPMLIALRHDGRAVDATAEIIDMQGRIQSRAALNAAAGAGSELSVAALAAGNYMLCITDAAGNSSRQMITVAH